MTEMNMDNTQELYNQMTKMVTDTKTSLENAVKFANEHGLIFDFFGDTYIPNVPFDAIKEDGEDHLSYSRLADQVEFKGKEWYEDYRRGSWITSNY